MDMPNITYIGETREEFEIVDRITNKGRLRATCPPKPKFEKIEDGEGIIGYHYEYASPEDRMKGHAGYVWRMVAFMISPKSEHHCMPVTVDLYLGHVKAESKVLDKLTDKIIDAVPIREWHGIVRWGKAIGTF